MANLSKINIKGTLYELKDAKARQDLSIMLNEKAAKQLGTAAFVDYVSTINKTTPSDTVLVTEKALVDALAAGIGSLGSAVSFRGIIEKDEREEELAAIERLVTSPVAGDIVLVKDSRKEYIFDGEAWQELGDEGSYLTVLRAEQDFVKKFTKIAGIDLENDITTTELEEALDLKALAHKSSAEGVVQTVDSADNITVAIPGQYDVVGDTVPVPSAFSALDVTPSGTVELTQTSGAIVEYEKAENVVVNVNTVTEEEKDKINFIPRGSIIMPSFNSTIDGAKENISVMTDPGVSYSISDGNIVKGQDSIDSFAKAGVLISVGENEDAETLIISDASTGNAVISTGEINYTPQVLSGALPVFGEKSVVTSATITTTAVGEASFKGVGVAISAEVVNSPSNANVTQAAYKADFAGNSKTVTPTVSSTVSAISGNAKVDIASESKEIKLNKSGKTITVE